jgi:hypothetical protein
MNSRHIHHRHVAGHLASTTALLAVALLLPGCTAETRDTPEAVTPETSTVSPAPPSPTPRPQPADDATVQPVPEVSDAGRVCALTAATTVVTTFGRPDLPYPEWIAGLYPLLTQAGAAAYEDTDPTLIPITRTTGNGIILPGSTELALTVQIPTDAGSYNVSLTRPAADADWLADRIRPAGA